MKIISKVIILSMFALFALTNSNAMEAPIGTANVKTFLGRWENKTNKPVQFLYDGRIPIVTISAGDTIDINKEFDLKTPRNIIIIRSVDSNYPRLLLDGFLDPKQYKAFRKYEYKEYDTIRPWTTKEASTELEPNQRINIYIDGVIKDDETIRPLFLTTINLRTTPGIIPTLRELSIKPVAEKIINQEITINQARKRLPEDLLPALEEYLQLHQPAALLPTPPSHKPLPQ